MIGTIPKKNRTKIGQHPPALFIADLLPIIFQIWKKSPNKIILSEKIFFGRYYHLKTGWSQFEIGQGLPDLKSQIWPKSPTEIVTGLFCVKIGPNRPNFVCPIFYKFYRPGTLQNRTKSAKIRFVRFCLSKIGQQLSKSDQKVVFVRKSDKLVSLGRG